MSCRGDTRFVQEPIDMPFGRWALFEDPEGNRFPLMSKRLTRGRPAQ
ncbi:MAG: hypothetical protein M3N28_06695 [Actinomycetota bacterium]|nr:hypothetical protein [Actinomycetota bacterium]